MDTKLAELIEELKNLQDITLPVKNSLDSMPEQMSFFDKELAKIKQEIEDLKRELNGTKDLPSLHYRISILETGAKIIPDIVKDVRDIKLWKENINATMSRVTGSTIDVVIKTIIPWILTIISVGILTWIKLG